MLATDPTLDRDPTCAYLIGAHVRAVFHAVWWVARGNTDAASACVVDEASAGLLNELRAQGCLTPAEREGAYVEAVEVDGLLTVRVPSFGWLQLTDAGKLDVIPE